MQCSTVVPHVALASSDRLSCVLDGSGTLALQNPSHKLPRINAQFFVFNTIFTFFQNKSFLVVNAKFPRFYSPAAFGWIVRCKRRDERRLPKTIILNTKTTILTAKFIIIFMENRIPAASRGPLQRSLSVKSIILMQKPSFVIHNSSFLTYKNHHCCSRRMLPRSSRSCS